MTGLEVLQVDKHRKMIYENYSCVWRRAREFGRVHPDS